MKEINKRGGRPKKFGSLVCGGKEETPRKEKMSVVSLFNSCSPTSTCALWKLKNPLTSWKELRPNSRNGVRLGNYHSTNWINKNGFKVKAFFFNPTDDPIIKQALKVSFFSPLLSYYSFVVL
ncbi:hypothetical protein RGQ29_003199 [Quercus rubra]|uniref:Uncharacterized protein n=1 Tax=Quercus rubra TaxID=3512 RepID=A0AAN7EB13_QUERU|nr:hypothetical protein RGQ29_003199 [Quercus rubra]